MDQQPNQEIGKRINLFYDKFAGDHHFQNKITRKVTIQDLEDGSFLLYSGDEGLKIYNAKFSANFSIPQHLLNSELYQLRIYMKIVAGLETIYTVVSVNSAILEHCVKNKKPIPEADFLKSLCRYHQSYTQSNKEITNFIDYNSCQIDEKINKNTQYIGEKASTCVDYTNDPRIDNPKELSTELFEFQKCSINWMLEKERTPTTIAYNLYEEVQIGNVYFDMHNQNFHLLSDRKKITFYGGGLVDEVGMGKTIQMITLGLKNPSDSVDYTRETDPHKLYSRATLIICPNQLCGQWKREFKNMIKKDDQPDVVLFLTKRDHDKYTYQDVLDADFVIISYTFLDNASFTLPWTKKLSTVKSFHRQGWGTETAKKVDEEFKKMGKELLKDPINTLENTNVQFQLINWHRIVVDEFHEVYTVAKYRYIKNLLPHLRSKYRWVVTATPFIKNASLDSMVDFLTDYTNTDNNKIFTKDNIVDYLSFNCFRRNTKQSTEEIEKFKLPPVEEEVRWLKFSTTERMMYNAYIANPNNDKFGIYLRQLCCHPQLADETKLALSNCKTLKDIEKMMVAHYKKDVDEATIKKEKIDERIKKVEKKIRKCKRKQKKKQLKKMGVKFDDSDSDSNSDSNSESDSDSGEDDELAAIIATLENDNPDINLDDIENKPSVTLENLNESLDKLKIKLEEATTELKGKQTSFDFFNNVVSRLRKNVTKDTSKKSKLDDIDLTGDNIMDLYDQLDSSSDEDDEEEEEECGICMDVIPEDDTGVTKCGHIFCYECLKMCIGKYHNCPYCKMKLKDTEIFFLSYERKKKKVENAEEKAKDDLINDIGTKLANLIFYLRENDDKVIIFSQWDNLLRRVGRILTENKIKNVFCRGNCYQRDKAIREFNEGNSIKVIMLSSESAASGTNLTKATRVIFLDPIYGSYKFRKDQERQAVGRAHRMGQKNVVKIVRFIVRNSIEEDIYWMNCKEDEKHVDSKDYDKFQEVEIV